MLTLRLIPVLLTLALLSAGCGTSEQAAETATTPASPAPAVETPPQQFRSQVDTVSAVRMSLPALDSAAAASLAERFVVQIGAFKDPALANTAQSLARGRYAMTVLNDYNPLVGLYQIRVGFFDTKEEAYLFRARIQKEFPEEYKDAWVVQFK